MQTALTSTRFTRPCSHLSRPAKLPQMEDFGFGSPALVLTFLRILFALLIKISIKLTSAASAIDTTSDIDSE